ncbi:MAG: type II toxin-antitoxin system HicA family toxin [Betaproteobacteria bacterium]|nr:type II toxin-antitoxin system HicA family toxin [Betaproteobacteria bacterium]
MSHKHAHLIEAIFQDPINGNIQWHDVESLLTHLGADVQTQSGASLHVKLNGFEGALHRPHHSNSLSRQDVKHLREFLAHARVTPSMYQEAHKH